MAVSLSDAAKYEKVLKGLRAGRPLSTAAAAAGLRVGDVRGRASREPAYAKAIETATQAGRAEDVRGEPVTVAASQPDHPTPIPDRESFVAQPPAPLTDAHPRDAERWRTPRAEAAVFGPGLLGTLLWINAMAAGKGIPAMSAWWRSTFAAFYASTARWLLLRVGRGGGKSTTLCQMAANEVLFGDRLIPPGQSWIWPFISVSSEDATRRIGELQAIYEAVRVTAEVSKPHGHSTLRLEDTTGQEVGFVSLAGTVASVSGPTTLGGTIDEEAKLRDQRGLVNPATEILASLIQTFRGRPGVHGIRCSSAWTTQGSHAASIADGSTEVNHVATIGEPFLEDVLRGLREVAAWEQKRGDRKAAETIRAYATTVTAASPNVPTWIANPTIPALVSRLEVDALPPAALDGMPRVLYWMRENVSVPIDAGSAHAAIDQWEGLAEANRRLCAQSRPEEIWTPTDGARW